MEEASGSRYDAVSTNTLTDVNTVGQGTGKKGYGADFERDNSELFTAVDGPDISFGDVDFTICCWFNVESLGVTGYPCIFTKKGGTKDEYQLYYDIGQGKFYFWVKSDGGTSGQVALTAPSPPSTATWYFLWCEHDASGNTIKISVNDGTKYSAAFSSGVADSNGSLNIGGYAADGYFDGIIDEFGIWKRKLSDTEITYLYNAGAGRTYPFAP
jgi:hypothetical protein